MRDVNLILGAIVLLLLAIDWLQTLIIVTSNGRWWERNPGIVWLLKRWPDRMRSVVNVWFGCTVIATFLIIWKNQGRFGLTIVLFVFVICELICVVNNHLRGIPTGR